MPFGDMEEMFEELRHRLGGHKHRVVKTIKPTKEEILEWMTLKGYQENAKKAAGMHKSFGNLFWSKIELRTGEVSRSLQFNPEKQVIEVIECEKGSSEPSEWES